jgi:hypothetical protein
MWRRVSRDDLKRTAELMLQQQGHSGWWICDEYEIQGDKIVAKYDFHPWVFIREDSRSDTVIRSYQGGKDHHWREYRPLEQAPELFLKLAYLSEDADASDFEEAALVFSHKYGLPGGDNSRAEDALTSISLSEFRAQSRLAWFILKMYEAALNRNLEAAEAAVRLSCVERPDLLPGNELDKAEQRRRYIQHAMTLAASFVHLKVINLCRPGIHLTAEFYGPEPESGVRSIWIFDNLLGAAYLQMYWVMTSGGELTRCEHCGRLLSLARPHPDGRKRRRDRRFCDDACRQAHHRSKERSADGLS